MRFPDASGKSVAGEQGGVLLEAVLAMAVFGTLADEGLEAARSIRNDGWTLLVAGPHGISKSGGKWAFSGANDATTDGGLTYTRVVTVASVNRNGSGDIVTSGGSVDLRTMLATSTVTWNNIFGQPKSLSSSAYLTNWNVFDWTQDTDFSAGTTFQTQAMNTGTAAVVQLAQAKTTWHANGGVPTIHTSDSDFNPGTFSNTCVTGTGDPTSVVETATLGWTVQPQGMQFYQTSDTDFSPGTLTNTAVSGTGSGGQVNLDTEYSWRITPTGIGNHLNGVSILSSSDGFAVSDNGTLIRWNGTTWTQYTSSVNNAMNGVSMINPSFGIAVGADGRIQKYDGTSWAEQTSPTNKILMGISLASTTFGFAFGDQGALLKWDGTNWTAQTSPTPDTLHGVSAVGEDRHRQRRRNDRVELNRVSSEKE